MRMLRTKTAFLAILLALLALLGGTWTHPAPTAAGQPTPASSPPDKCVKPQTSSGNLTLDICASRVHYKFGETVNITLTLTNTGPTPLHLDSFTGSFYVIDRQGVFKVRLAFFSCFIFENCSLTPGQSMTKPFYWQTDSQYEKATLSGPYTVLVNASACPTGGTCLEATIVPLRITVSVPQN